MNKGAKVIANYLLVFAVVFSILLMCFVLASPSVTLDDGTSSANVNEDEGMIYNISVNTTSGDWDNVTLVNITLPGTFTFYLDSNGTDAVGEFTNTSSTLTWENSSDSLVLNDSKNYFWFNASFALPGWYNITAQIINSSGWSLDINIAVEVNDTTPASDVSFVTSTTTPANYSQNWIYANVSVTDNGMPDTLNITLYDSLSAVVDSNSSSTMRNEHNFTGLSDGLYYLNASFNDSYGNINYSTTYTILLDTTGPGTVVLTSPQNATIQSSTSIEVNVSAADSLVGLETIVLSLSNSTDLLDTNTSSATSINITYSGLAEGIYYINATANDTLGNSNVTSLTTTVIIDTASPTLDLSASTNSGNYSQTWIYANVTVTENNLDTINLTLYNSTGLVDSSSNTSDSIHYYNFTSLVDGIYYLNASANDSAGNINYSTTYVIILDTVGPGTVILTAPQNGTIVSSTEIAVNLSAADSLVGVETIILSLSNSTNLLDTNLSSATSINITYTSLSEGTYYINATANDTLGNSNTTAFTTVITLDTISPEAIFVSPGDYENRTVSNLTVNVTITDNNPDSVVLKVYNSTGSLLDTNTTTSGEEVSYTSLFDDTYFINITVNDSANNVNYSSRYVIVNAYPEVNLTSPFNNTQSNSAVQTFNCSATSAINLSSISLYIWNSSGDNISEANITELSGLSNLTSWSQNLSSEGTYYWNCFVNDTLGNETWGTTNQTIILDTMAPEITLDSPANVSSTTSSYNFTFNVSDSHDLAGCSLIIDGSISASNSSAIGKTNTNGIVKGGIAVGAHTWSINCTDMAGNINASASRTLTVSSSGTPTSPSGGGGGGYPTYTLTNETFRNGYTRMLQKGWKFKFQVMETSHTLELKKISKDEVTIEIKSDPQTVVISLGEEKKLDVTDDSIYDISVKLEDIVGSNANLTVKSISQEVPADNSGEPQTTPEGQSPETQDDAINSPEGLPPMTYDKSSDVSQWITAFVIIVVIVIVIVILLKGNNKKRRRRKKIFELSQF